MENRIKYWFSEDTLPFSFVCFYWIGLILFMFPFTRELFVSITSLTLIGAYAVVFYYHRNWNQKTILWFLFIFLSSFFLEMVGVETGKIFGKYAYGKALGIQINGIPIIIGLNWLFLVYASHDIARKVFANRWMRIFVGAFLMLFYDILLEWVAAPMQMWYFANNTVPFSNFLTWFLASVVYHAGFEFLDIRSDNRPVRYLFGTQLLFFFFIGLYTHFFHL